MKWKKAVKKPIEIEYFQITEDNVISLHNIDDRLGHIYSRSMDQDYPRRCIKCGKLEPVSKREDLIERNILK